MIIGRNKSVDKSVNQRSTQRVNGRDPNKLILDRYQFSNRRLINEWTIINSVTDAQFMDHYQFPTRIVFSPDL